MSQCIDDDDDSEFTSEQIANAIAHAIGVRDFEIIPALIKTLALQDPRQAEAVYKSMMAALAHARRIVAG
jgi:hypothetical protein